METIGNPSRTPRFPRNLEAGRDLDLFFAAAVTAVLAIRFGLALTGYPSLGGTQFHIAHMLWGGLLMLVALLVVIGTLGKHARRWAAVLGGAGFGTFIDELGKFITRDNDYFYRPTVALIYVTFVLVYLGTRWLERSRRPGRFEYLVNAIQAMEEVARRDLDVRERERAREWLAQSDRDSPLVRHLELALQEQPLVPVPAPAFWVRMSSRLAATYRRWVRRRLFRYAIVVFFVGQLLVRVIQVANFATRDEIGNGGATERLLAGWEQLGTRDVSSLGMILSTAVGGVFVATGVLRLLRDRLRAYMHFERSVLITITLTQVFMFHLHQWSALGGLTFNLLLWAAVRQLIRREEQLRDTNGGSSQ